eukprot:m.24312 g.24312  ORF g.24312 m.24312 type:complete len:465 (+) comp4152_c0_seq1:395-1789(+)
MGETMLRRRSSHGLPLAVIVPVKAALATDVAPPPRKSTSVPQDDDVTMEHSFFQAVHRNDICRAKNAIQVYGKDVASTYLASPACRHDRPLHRAVRCGWTQLAAYLLETVGVPVNATKPDGATALFLAAQEGYAHLVTLLLNYGADIDAPDEDGISPLYIACYQGHEEVVNTLLAAGANPNKLGKDGTSPTFIAAQEGYAGIVSALAMAGAECDKLDDEGTAPLLMASQEGRPAAVSVLLAVGVNPNTATPRGVRPLHSAAQNGYLRIVQLLLAYGADPSLKTQSGASAIKLAADFGHAEVAAWIEAAVAGWSPLRVCVEARFHWVAASMLASGEADGYLGSAGAAARLMRRARSSKPGMPLVQGVPKCLTTCQVIDAAMGPWRPKNHALFGPKFRELVRFLLMVRHRISYTGPAGRCMSPVALGMPLLPVEMWLAIISHIPRQEIDGPCAEARPLGMFAVSSA